LRKQEFARTADGFLDCRNQAIDVTIARTHYGSLGAPDLIFEQEVEDPGTVESQIKKVTENKEFQQWAKQVSGLLEQSSKRELCQITSPAS